MAHIELVVAWLNDADVMEQGIVQVLERHAADAKDRPQMQTRLQQHLEPTRRHAALVKGCVERLGGVASAVKTGMATVMSAVQGMTTSLARDDLVKNTLHDYGKEHFAIACYTLLIAAARDLGEQEVVEVCRQILRYALEMADLLIEQIPPVTTETLQLQHAMSSR